MKIFRKLARKKYILLNILFLFIFIAFLIPQRVLALDIPHLLSGILIPIISGLGKLLTTLINLLIAVAQYNEFVNSTAVSRGWIIIRDICNMFFIIVLLVIAFATVLNIEKYSVKRLLGGFLLAAVLVNFSKLICGVLIDAGQILMLTFVKAFSAAAEGNFVLMLGLDKILMLNASESISDTDVVGALLLGFIMTVVALIVIGIMTIILVFRIVILWFLVLLSPLAFVTSILPGLQKYSSQWWQKFTSQIIVGPVMAFFIWLSLVVVSGNASGTSLLGVDTTDSRFRTLKEIEELKNAEEPLSMDQILNIQTETTEATISEAGQPQYVLNFMIGIAMLIGSLMVAQEMGVAGGKMAGNMVNKMQSVATGVAKAPFAGLKKTAKFLGGEGVRELEAATKIPLTKSRWKSILEERKEVSQERRDKKWGRPIEKGVLSYMPQGVKGWAHVLHMKGGPESLKGFFQGISGKAGRLREQGVEKQDELDKVGEEIKVKTTKEDYDELNKDITQAEQNITQAKQIDQSFNIGKEINVSEIEGFLGELRQRASFLAESKKEADNKEGRNVDFLIKDIEKAKDKADKEGIKTIKTSDLQKENEDIFVNSGLNWAREEKKIAETNLKNLIGKKDKYSFVEDDQEESQKNLQDLQGKITELSIDKKAKEELVNNLNGLIKDMNEPFKDLTLEKREEMADRVWQIQKKVKDLRKKDKIDKEETEDITSLTGNTFLQLKKGVASMEDMSKKVKSQKNLTKETLDLQAAAELIQPRTMTSDQRKASNREVLREYEELKGVDDGDELKAMYIKAEKQNNTGMARAALMKLNDNFDLNELMEDLGVRQNYEGMADLAERMSKTMSMPLQEAYMFMNDLGATNKLKGRFRFHCPVVREKSTGLYRPAKSEEHEALSLIESGKTDRETLYRRGSWGAIFGKEKDPVSGERVPIWDSTTKSIMERDLTIILKEIDRARLQPEHERNMCHKISIEGFEKMRPGLIPSDKIILDRVLKHFKNIQPKYYSGVESKKS